MKICLFWQTYGPYHFARLRALQKMAKERGHEAVGLEISEISATYAWRRTGAGDQGIHTLFPAQVAEKMFAWSIYRQAVAYFRQARCDVVFTPSYWPLYSVAVAMAARSVGSRVVMMNESHRATGNNSPPALAIKKLISGTYDAAFVGGTIHRRFHRELGFKAGRIFDGYDAVDNDYFETQAELVRQEAASWRRRFGLPERFVLNIGRFVAKKNLEVLVRAFAIARAKNWLNGCDLVLVGEGPEKQHLLREALQQNLTVLESEPDCLVARSAPGHEVIRFYPFAQIVDLPVYYALAECFILPSIYEEWGLVVNEAMASGCAVLVSTAVGCAKDLVVHGQTGFCFNPKDVDGLAQALRAICQSPALAVQLGANAKKHMIDWSCAHFAEGALGAANSALGLAREATQSKFANQEPVDPARIIVVQTCFPDYREVVFDELNVRLGGGFELVCGTDYFTRDIKPCLNLKPWKVPVGNVFLFGRNLVWQRGVLRSVRDADLVVLELNPRILNNWIVLAGRRLAGQPTFFWGHIWAREGRKSWTNVFRLMLMTASNGVIAYSETQKKELGRYLPRKRLYVAPNSVTLRTQCHSDPANEVDLTDIVFVGRLSVQKKPELLVAAFLALAPRLPDQVRLVIVGDGVKMESLRRTAEASGYGNRIIFAGHVIEDEALRRIYGKAFCSASPGYVGLSAVQSFANGVPMVIADGELHSPEIETCRDGYNCLFFKSGNVADFAAQILKMWQDKNAWFARRQDMSDWVKTNYSVDVMVDGFVNAVNDGTVTE